MNIEHMKEVREFISYLPDKACDMSDYYEITIDETTERYVTFSLMKRYGFACGSAACFAGWTAMIAHQKTPYEIEMDVSDDAQEYLDLTGEEANWLFTTFPDDTPEEGWKTWMLARLDDCIEKGEVTCWYKDDDPDSDDDPIDDADYNEDDE